MPGKAPGCARMRLEAPYPALQKHLAVMPDTAHDITCTGNAWKDPWMRPDAPGCALPSISEHLEMMLDTVPSVSRTIIAWKRLWMRLDVPLDAPGRAL